MLSPAAPSRARLASLLWFPFFFAAAASVLFVLAFAAPAPHALAVGVVGTEGQVSATRAALEQAHPDGFVVRRVVDAAAAGAAVRGRDLAAGYLPSGPGQLDEGSSQLLVASGASATRAEYLTGVLEATALSTGASPLTVTDLVPLAPGDASGVGLFFYGLPLLLVGLITSIVLLQLGPWPLRNKVAAIAAAGAFASCVAWATAVWCEVLPADGWLLLSGFALTQAIGWLTTAAALAVRHHFVPVAMTFVLLLGIPTSGGTVSADMLPAALGWLHQVLPFAALIDVTRSSAYFDHADLLGPSTTLLAWVLAGALLLAAARRAGARASTIPPTEVVPAAVEV